MNKYLLEIGTEEVPARFIDDSLNQLKNKAEDMFKEERICFDNIKTYATPRRLVLLIENIAERQEDLEELVRGPAKRIAYDEEGNPTKALMGFAKGQGVEVDDIIIKEYKGEDYVFAQRVLKGKDSKEVLKENIPELIKSITFPKSMKWGKKSFRFVRPIRWVLSLFNNEPISFDFEGIKVSNITKGHRFLGSSNIEINSVDEYFEKLRENYVIVDQNERKELIIKGCRKLAQEKGGNILDDEELLNELTHIVEYPTPLRGRIKDDYLKLPKEVITTPMKEHQRYLPIVDDNKNLLPYFIAVRNGNDEYIDIVTKGNEKVLDARLEDAKFFYNEDVKKPLEDYVEGLKDIVFQEQLGTVWEKTNRIIRLSEKIGETLEVGDETLENTKRAAYLSKADLVTKMVYEFTELQGIMGREYAKTSGENEIVSLAIYEHYLPRFAQDELPTTTAGAMLSISDKIDTIAGCFAIGIQPTGSQDPYGLRRQALGIVNILLDRNIHISLDKLIDYSLNIYEENGLTFNYDEVKKEILEFFKARIRNMFIDNGIRYDVVDAVLNSNNYDIADLYIRASELNKWIKKDELSEILAAFNRVSNLAKKAENKVEINTELLIEEQEKTLYKTFKEVKNEVEICLNNKEYNKALDTMITLRGPIDEFFDNVMVMVDDEKLKNNRLSLIKEISDTMLKICDLSKIVNK
ncbi:glycine--tRNA ligase subunit beta [Thermohalobacter berrensis]|uniref:Glycine--tRNA ligase beta subunit n=1 Tax=Thermohalobacter berrensis TaxID=99594 RepID=A0A419TBC8_9FIRM|nr:glycine--tRNA ligase subunit beta [Thermohalobacter berrensis]